MIGNIGTCIVCFSSVVFSINNLSMSHFMGMHSYEHYYTYVSLLFLQLVSIFMVVKLLSLNP